jgi:hypothetical protein
MTGWRLAEASVHKSTRCRPNRNFLPKLWFHCTHLFFIRQSFFKGLSFSWILLLRDYKVFIQCAFVKLSACLSNFSVVFPEWYVIITLTDELIFRLAIIKFTDFLEFLHMNSLNNLVIILVVILSGFAGGT